MQEFLISFDISKRELEIRRALVLFEKAKKDILYFEDASVKVVGVYFKILSSHVKPLIPKKVSKFKMASVLALTIVKLQPIQDPHNKRTKSSLRRINAELAFFLAMNLILDMAKPEGYEREIGIKFIEDSIKSVKNQHLSYLTLKDINSFPIFPIASFYYCFFVIFKTRYNALSN